MRTPSDEVQKRIFSRVMSVRRSGGRGAKACFARLDDRLRARFHAELVEDGGHHVAHRLLAEIEVRRDLVVVEATGEEFEQLALAACKPRERAVARRGRQESPHLFEEMLPGGLALQQDVIAARQRNESPGREEGRGKAAPPEK